MSEAKKIYLAGGCFWGVEKNSEGHCHIDSRKFATVARKLALLPRIEQLTPLQYEVTQHSATEAFFANIVKVHWSDSGRLLLENYQEEMRVKGYRL